MKLLGLPNLQLYLINPWRANTTKWSNTLKQFVGMSMFDHFVELALKWLSGTIANIALFKLARRA